MLPIVLDTIPKEDLGVEKYRGIVNSFRNAVSESDDELLPTVQPNETFTREHYLNLVNRHPRNLIIDLRDVELYLRKEDSGGLSILKVMDIAEIVCSNLCYEADINDVIWNRYDEDLTAQSAAILGVDETSWQVAHAFDHGINTVYDIISVIKRYLVNGRTPQVRGVSVYGPKSFDRGYLVLGLQTYDELIRNIGLHLDGTPL